MLGEVLPLTMFKLKKLVGEWVILWQRHSLNDSQSWTAKKHFLFGKLSSCLCNSQRLVLI